MKTLILTGDDVRALLEPRLAIDAVTAAFDAHARGRTQMPPKVYISLPRFHGDFRAMPAAMDEAAGVKWINAHPDNPTRHGLPSVIGVYVYSDPATAVPLAIMDATAMTALRTGAAAAVATSFLARAGASTLGVVGCGAQARAVIACHREVMEPSTIVVYDRSPAAADALVRAFPEGTCRSDTLRAAASCDVVCTLTPSREPILEASMLRPGVHINAMGADAPGKQELDPAILLDSRVFLDDRKQAMESGEVNVSLHDGRFPAERIAGTLGEVVAGMIEGRGAADTTVFDSTGLAVQDLAVARVVYEQARASGRGMEIELIRP